MELTATTTAMVSMVPGPSCAYPNRERNHRAPSGAPLDNAMEPDRIQASAFRDQLWASLPALLPEINRLAGGEFSGSERERQLIQVIAKVVAAEMQFRADDSRLES